MGLSAGRNYLTVSDNAFFGFRSGFNNTASGNSFFGSQSGDSVTSGLTNSFFGYKAGAAVITASANSFFGYNAGILTTAHSNAFFGTNAGESNTTGNNNTFFGISAGDTNTTGNNNTVIGANADVNVSTLTFATAIGAGAVVSNNNTVVLGRSSDDVRVPGTLVALSDLFLVTLGSAGSTDVCRNASNQLSTCSSSLRYKNNVQTFTGGLNIVRRLRPITFNWKDGGMNDVGFAAEEVNKVEPLLSTYNDKGEVEGVKYGQITTVLVNAVREQQQVIEQQQRQIDTLKKLVCLSHPDSNICKEKEELK